MLTTRTIRSTLLAASTAAIAACSPGVPEGTPGEPPAAAVNAPAPAARVAVEPIEPGEYTITVYKSPTCGCCTDWEEHMEENGFTVVSHVTDEVYPVKLANGLPAQLASCHTGFVEGYLVEGHVPASDVIRMLRERPQLAGIAVPGMPIGSPGMEYGNQRDPYDVIAYDSVGNLTVFARY
jgi:hypothetical protein